MRRLCVALLVLAGCSFDRGGLGAQGRDDASVQPGPPDAAVQPGMPDAPVAPTIDAMMPGTPDAGDDHAGIVCGTMTCTGNNVCCVGTGGPGGPGGQTFDCKDHCGGNEGTYACDGPEDCPGEDCCFSRTASRCASGCSLGEQAACRMSSDCGGVDSCCPTQYPNVELCQLACF